MKSLFKPLFTEGGKWEDDKKPTSQKTCPNLTNSKPAGKQERMMIYE